LTLFILTALVACNRAEVVTVEEVYAVVSAAEIEAGDPVPPPAGPVILTIRGNIENTNVDDTLQFDMATLERLGLVEYSVDDKQAEGGEALFRGVLIDQLLAVAGAAADATTLNTVALNDYGVEIPITDVRTYPVLLATAVDGERMDVARYGPTRVIYPYGFYDLDETVYDPRWIWQLATIEVR
jgi:hypothetical protein